ncbi:hypothetical protein TWF192_000693 [Orbilia oligospora]|uniref:Uncharacterized protein n=1 Tax=Orbilia oligospora TaxID=2813651 RepID=A0A6G1LVP5_ORBOL|nr:hypothetical protein TWF191_002323 [Orbilia oligospora]KAF3235555.1 hypothetical protein TWF192_000693 [Orbilia oligospora]
MPYPPNYFTSAIEEARREDYELQNLCLPPPSPAELRRQRRRQAYPTRFPPSPPPSPELQRPPPITRLEPHTPRPQQQLAVGPGRRFDYLASIHTEASAIIKDLNSSLERESAHPDAVCKSVEELQRDQANRVALVPHPLFFGSKTLILHPTHFTSSTLEIISATMDEENGIHQFPGEDSALVFTTPAFLKASSEDFFMHESPNPYEETPIRPRRSKRSTGGKTKPRGMATPHYTAAADLRSQAEGTLFEGMSPFKQADFDMAEYLNLSPEKQITRTPAPRLAKSRLNQLMETAKPASLGDFAFTTPAPNMNWGGNEENESPIEDMGMRTVTKAIDPRILELDETDDDEIVPLSNVKARTKPFSQRLSDRSSKRRRSNGISTPSERLPLQDLDASAQNTVQAEVPLVTPQKEVFDKSDKSEKSTTPAPSSPCSDSEDLQTPKAIPPKTSVDTTPRIPSTDSVDMKASPSRLPIPTRRTRALSDPPSLPSHLDKTKNQGGESMKTFTFSPNCTWQLEISVQNSSKSKLVQPGPETPTTPKAKPVEVLSEQDKELMESPRYQGLPKSPMQLRKLVIHTQEILEAERRARIEAEKTIEFMNQERQFLMLQLDNAKKRARSRTNSPRTKGTRQDAVSATPAPAVTQASSLYRATTTPARFTDDPRSEGYATDDVTIERRQNPALAAALARHQEDVIANRLTPNEAGRRRREVIREAENSKNMSVDEKVDWNYREERRVWEDKFAHAQTYRKPTEAELEIAAAYARDDAKGEIEERRRARQQQRDRGEESRPTPAARPPSRTNSTRTQTSTSTQSSRPQSMYTRPGSSLSSRRDPVSQTRPGSSLQARPPSSLQTRSGASRPQSTAQSRTQPARPQSRVQSTRPESRQEGPLRQKPVRGNR